MSKAVFCGTFDPFTLGHLDILQKAGRVFDKVFVAVAADNEKNTRTSLGNRIKIAKASIEGCSFAEVVSFDGLLTDFCRVMGVSNLVRGIRNPQDLYFETDLLRNYQSQNPQIECTYFVPSASVLHISSTYVRQLCSLNGDISSHVSKSAIELILQTYK